MIRGYAARRTVTTPPSPWDNWDRLTETIGREPGTPRAAAAEKAVGILRSTLGEDWLVGDPQALPPEIALAFSHTVAFAQLLELALRLAEFRDASGAAALRRSLKTNKRADSWRHVQLQLELATLAAAAGASVAFEKGPGDGWPADVVLSLDDLSIAFETFSVMTSQPWRDASRVSDEISERLLALEFRHKLSIVADFQGGTLPPVQLEDWLQRVEEAAAAVVSDGQTRTVTAGVVTATIAPEDLGPPSHFSGPPIIASPWERILRRLQQKRDQASESPHGVWLRVDFLDGIWQFSEWAQYPLGQKLLVMEEHLHQEFAGASPTGLAGMVISTGAALAQGRFVDEGLQTPAGSIGLRRNLRPVRVRETLIIPLADEAEITASFLARAYDAEPNSLESSLQLAGLGTLEEVFPRQT
jgi:hypothetical protein